jgi:Uncharacterised protein family (UPF0175)
MSVPASDNELMQYWSKLTDEEKQSLLKMAKRYVVEKENVTGTDELQGQLLQEESAEYRPLKNRIFTWEDVRQMAVDKEKRMAVAVLLFEEGLLSSGHAARFAGISRREFLETAGTYGVSIFGETPSDLKTNFFDV